MKSKSSHVFCFAHCKLMAAQRVVSGEIPISQALLPAEGHPEAYEVHGEPDVPSRADETILALDFPQDTDLTMYELVYLDCSGTTFHLPASVLDTAKTSITPVGIIEYLASQEIHFCPPPSDIPLWKNISNTNPLRREKIWGYFLSKACKEWEERTGQYLYLKPNAKSDNT